MIDHGFESFIPFYSTPEALVNDVAGDFRKVYLANRVALDVVGIRDASIIMPSRPIWNLQKVLHIPEQEKSLISVGQLDEEGHEVKFGG